MGRRIDRAALWIIGLGAAWLLYLRAWGSRALALALTAASGLCAAALLRRHRPARRRSATVARAMVEALSRMEEGEALAILGPLLRRRWPGEDFDLCLAQKHPSASLTANDVLVLWRARRGRARLAMAATCPVEPKARVFAAGLSHPSVALLDAARLARLFAHGDLPPELAHPPRPAPRRRLSERLARPLPWRTGVSGLGLLGLYLVTGHPLCLLGGLWVAFRWGASRLCGRGGRRLFAEH